MLINSAKFDADNFLREYWQKKPLLIKNPWNSWSNPLEPDELAGLAGEEQIESRLITKTGNIWGLEHGPFSAAHFQRLDKKQWTLLVQAVDHSVPEVAAVIAPFRFIPNWRIDDVMVSYASDGGGVGPHFDQYDVFLVQGLGKRRWQIGERCTDQSALIPHDDLRLLADFEATDEWLLEPGDMLYVPPGISHNGVAVGEDCMTYSIGFRAPTRKELIGYWMDDLLVAMDDDDHFADPDLHRQENPGQIRAEAIARLHEMITDKTGDRDAFMRWFGTYNSTRKYPELDWSPEKPIEIAELRKLLSSGVPLLRNPASRFSYVEAGDAGILLFVDGVSFEIPVELVSFAKDLCSRDSITIHTDLIDSDFAMLQLATLYNSGSLMFAEIETD